LPGINAPFTFPAPNIPTKFVNLAIKPFLKHTMTDIEQLLPIPQKMKNIYVSEAVRNILGIEGVEIR